MASPGGERVYTLPELADISAIDYRTLHNWQKRGMLTASHRSVNGSGSTNLFDETDALQVLILAELRRSGVEVRFLEEIAGRIRELANRASGEELFVISGREVSLRLADDLPRALATRGPTVVLSVSGPRRALASFAAAA